MRSWHLLLVCLLTLQHAGRLEAWEAPASTARLPHSAGDAGTVLSGLIQAPTPVPARRDQILMGCGESAAEEDSDGFEDLCGPACILLGRTFDSASANVLAEFHVCTFGSRSLTLRALPMRC